MGADGDAKLATVLDLLLKFKPCLNAAGAVDTWENETLWPAIGIDNMLNDLDTKFAAAWWTTWSAHDNLAAATADVVKAGSARCGLMELAKNHLKDCPVLKFSTTCRD